MDRQDYQRRLNASMEKTGRERPPNGPPPGMPMIRAIAMPADSNANGDIFGGWLMAQMDLAGGNFASRVCEGRCATVAVDAMSFIRPVKIGDEVSVYAELIGTGKTSMRVRIEAWRRDRHVDEEKIVTKAVFTFVAIDDAGRPRPLPSRATGPAASL